MKGENERNNFKFWIKEERSFRKLCSINQLFFSWFYFKQIKKLIINRCNGLIWKAFIGIHFSSILPSPSKNCRLSVWRSSYDCIVVGPLWVEFACSPHAHVGFLRLLRFPPTDQKLRLVDNSKLSVGMSERVNGCSSLCVPVMDLPPVHS